MNIKSTLKRHPYPTHIVNKVIINYIEEKICKGNPRL